MPKTIEIEYFEASTYIGHEKHAELFKSSETALVFIAGLYEAYVVRSSEKASTNTASPGFRIEDDVLAKNDPATIFQKKVVWAEDSRQPGHVIWHKDYFYVTRKVLTLRED